MWAGATMPRRTRLIARLLGALLVPACAPVSSGGDGQGGTSTSTSGASLSGSATSATVGMSEATASGGGPTTSTTGTTTGLDSTGNPWTGEPCSFLGCHDAPGPVEDECDNFAQDCPEGQKCAAVITDGGAAWDAVKCVDVTGTDEPGDPCVVTDVINGIDSCIKGAMCWGFDEKGVGYCVALCTGSVEAPVCENKASCTISAEAILILCLPACDPLLQDCPNPVDACYPVNDGFTCAPDASGDEGQANDPCEFINVCDPGLWCADAAQVGVGCPQGSTGCCTPFCEFPGGACPNPDQQCVQYFDPMNLPADDPWLGIGYCGVPI